MPGNRKVTLFDEDSMRRAVLKVVKRGYSIRGVAAKTGLSYATLRKYVAKYNTTNKENRKSMRFFPNYEVNQVFTKELEQTLEQYLLVARKLHYGLTSENIKRLSYDLALKHNMKIPKSWEENKKAGKHWLYGYLRRHPLIYEILSWSRKFRPPIKKQYNTTVEIANKYVNNVKQNEDYEETIELTEKDVMMEPVQEPVIIIPLKKQKRI